jgi:hypothetical protein
MKLRTLTLMMACLAPAANLSAQIQINLDGLAAKAKESVQITLDSSMLQMAGQFLKADKSDKSDDAKIRNLLAGLKAITVRNFEFAEEGQYRPEDLQPVRAQLRAPAWSKVLGVEDKENHQTSEIYTKTEQGKIVGVTILNAEPKELSVVYIEGTIDLAGLSNLGGTLGIPTIPIPDKQKSKGKK